MKKMYKISIIAFIYSVILALVSYIFFKQYFLWAVLGSAVALFNNSLSIQILKRKVSAANVTTNIVTRFLMYLIVLAVVYFNTKEQGTNEMIYSYIFLLLGIFSLKIGIFIYHMPFIKKVEEDKDENDGTNN